MKRFLCDLVSGWSVTIKKWSVQITGLQVFVMGALYLLNLPAWVIAPTLVIMAAASIIASNLTQKTVATIDPTKVDVVPK
jgi:hypothetical protein